MKYIMDDEMLASRRPKYFILYHTVFKMELNRSVIQFLFKMWLYRRTIKKDMKRGA